MTAYVASSTMTASLLGFCWLGAYHSKLEKALDTLTQLLLDEFVVGLVSTVDDDFGEGWHPVSCHVLFEAGQPLRNGVADPDVADLSQELVHGCVNIIRCSIKRVIAFANVNKTPYDHEGSASCLSSRLRVDQPLALTDVAVSLNLPVSLVHVALLVADTQILSQMEGTLTCLSMHDSSIC